MAAQVVYTNFGGQIVHEDRGGTERDYVPDTLGNTIALVDATESVTDTWIYWPYGEVESRTGEHKTAFGFVGTYGYFGDPASGLSYVRSRHYLPDNGQWMTSDPIWPRAQSYAYAWNTPTSKTDPSGLSPCAPVCISCAPCLIDMTIVCPPGDGWLDCVEGVWDELPDWVKWLCGLACGGCILCVGGGLATRLGVGGGQKAATGWVVKSLPSGTRFGRGFGGIVRSVGGFIARTWGKLKGGVTNLIAKAGAKIREAWWVFGGLWAWFNALMNYLAGCLGKAAYLTCVVICLYINHHYPFETNCGIYCERFRR